MVLVFRARNQICTGEYTNFVTQLLIQLHKYYHFWAVSLKPFTFETYCYNY